LKWVIDIFLEKTPEGISHDEVLKEIKKLNGVLDIHHIHLWTLDGNKNYITIHALIDKKLSVPQIIALKKTIKDTLKDKKISHCVIEFEWEDENCEEKDFCE